MLYTKTHVKTDIRASQHRQTWVQMPRPTPGLTVHTRAEAGVSMQARQASLQRIVRVTPGTDHPRITSPVPCTKHRYEREEVNAMEPLYTLLLCLPAALGLIACACGLAILEAPTAHHADHVTVGKGRGGSSPHLRNEHRFPATLD